MHLIMKWNFLARLGSFLKIVLDKDICKREGLPLEFAIQKKPNDDDDDWEDNNDHEVG